ncbi:S1C family serine protease [Actinoplanes sp. NPDC051343]|jgi:S1-C subfamily serine protease|uniref:S1C family serine protease n=1 Tax=Actinoplanes sp. NPDC051343 TaxID=3363906 RepID=UPI0037BA0458
MSIPEQYTYQPAPGGWPPQHGGWSSPYQQAPPPPPRRRRGPIVAAVAGGLALLLGAAGAGFAAGWTLRPMESTSSQSSYLPLNPDSGGNPLGGQGQQGQQGQPGQQDQNGATDSQVQAVAQKVDPALVDIDTVLGAQNGEAAGTGIVITSDGVILTNNHVVAGATAITVTDIGNQKTYRAAVVGYDRTQDIAVLKLDGASGLTTATLSSTPAKAGQQIVAIGNAGGTGGTPSAVGGVISALNQSITASDESSGASEQLTGLIEVSADIEAGDSGGPLLSTDGQVLGVDTAASAGFQYQSQGGDGFAIPIDSATTIADQIRAGQASTKVHIGDTAYLGVELAGAARGQAQQQGPVVLGVVQDSPADQAGLARGDVIRSVGGTTVDSATTLTNRMDQFHPGDKVKLTWDDLNGQSHSSTLKLTTGPVG